MPKLSGEEVKGNVDPWQSLELSRVESHVESHVRSHELMADFVNIQMPILHPGSKHDERHVHSVTI